MSFVCTIHRYTEVGHAHTQTHACSVTVGLVGFPFQKHSVASAALWAGMQITCAQKTQLDPDSQPAEAAEATHPTE